MGPCLPAQRRGRGVPPAAQGPPRRRLRVPGTASPNNLAATPGGGGYPGRHRDPRRPPSEDPVRNFPQIFWREPNARVVTCCPLASPRGATDGGGGYRGRHRDPPPVLARNRPMLPSATAAPGHEETCSEPVAGVRFGAVTRPRTCGLRNSRHARPLTSGKRTSRRGAPNVSN